MKNPLSRAFRRPRPQPENPGVGLDEAFDSLKNRPKMWDRSRMGEKGEVRQAVLQRLLDDIQRDQKRNRRLYQTISAAASVLLIAVVGWLGVEYRHELQRIIFPAELIVVSTGEGELKTLTLSDGSEISMNESSTIRYPSRFARDKREVMLLDGEAFFQVQKDPNRPFFARTNITTTRVLGTSFNINAYAWMETEQITVASGQVSIANEILAPNDQLVYEKESGITSRRVVKAEDVALWRDGRLAFVDQDFKSVARILENKFGVVIQFGDADLKALRFTARFEKADGLLEVLDLLTLAGGVEYRIVQNTVEITRPNQQNNRPMMK
ncbi:FecR family protein [Parapedobacter deserti]|uniref:FecR family protein n=1 Tax=Parapedobacter deserti TaxID=1912957 RepID=A0ABV7JDC2_9SPHI